jgi:hypothetical protein
MIELLEQGYSVRKSEIEEEKLVRS